MRFILMLIVCLCLVPAAFGQERITKTTAGPNGETFRIAVAFIEPTEDSYKLQSLFVDVNPVKKNEQPTSFYVDLTTTVRSLATGEKKQKILVIRWEKSGDVMVKCEAGKWAKQTTGPELDNIIETVKLVVQNAPLKAQEPTDFKLPPDVEKRLTAILDGLGTSTLTCVRDGK
jgi:hypothetical protein